MGEYAPRGLEAAGRRLWRSVTSEFELCETESRLLLEICRTADQCERLHAAAAGIDGASPILVELRQQRLVLAKLTAALRLPADAEAQPPAATTRRGSSFRVASA